MSAMPASGNLTPFPPQIPTMFGAPPLDYYQWAASVPPQWIEQMRQDTMRGFGGGNTFNPPPPDFSMWMQHQLRPPAP